MTAPLALGISLAVALAARGTRAVSGSGAAAATLVGLAVLWGTGWAGAAVLGAFFVPSTLVGRLGARRPGAGDARGEQRDAVQVLANGGAGALGACAERVAPGAGFWILTAALAAAAADTWATALGAWSRRDPRDLLRRTPVPRGSSGGVTWWGTWGGVLGAFSVAATAAAVRRDGRLLGAGLVLGVTGMLLDSLLGAAWQARFRCAACGLPSERRIHRCGARTDLIRGWRWLDNDGVNALATALSGVAGALWFRLALGGG